MSRGRRRTIRLLGTAGALVAAFALGSAFGSPPTSHAGSAGGVLDDAEAHIAASAAQPVGRPALQRAAIEGMLAALHDRWASYYDAADSADFRASLTGGYSGVGLWIRQSGSTIVVASVTPGSAAARAGLRQGDVVEEVAGRPAGDVGDAVAALRGPAGTAVAVTVNWGSTQWTVRLTRAQVTTPEVSVTSAAPGITLIRVMAMTSGVGRQVRDAVAAAHAHHDTGLLLDLRGDPGGLLDEAVETASAFLSGGPVVTYTGRGGPAHTLDAVGGGDTTTPLVVVVDGGTASAAEVVAGALQDRGRAVIVGARTFGKSSVQEPTRLPDGSIIEITVAHYLTPNGRSLDGVGLAPDIAVAVGAPPAQATQRAIEVLAGLVADAHTVGRG